jgi:hypothetical protein
MNTALNESPIAVHRESMLTAAGGMNPKAPTLRALQASMMVSDDAIAVELARLALLPESRRTYYHKFMEITLVALRNLRASNPEISGSRRSSPQTPE